MDNSTAGRWTNEEHQKFLLGIQLYGKNWKKIQEMISTRNCSQIRSHAQKYFLKIKKEKHPKSELNHEESSNHQPSVNPDDTNGHLKNLDLQNYSYFLHKIMEYTRTHESMDIWEALIDKGTRKETVAVGNSQEMQDKKSDMEIYTHSHRKYSQVSRISDLSR